MTIKDLLNSIKGIGEKEIQEWLTARYYISEKWEQLDKIRGIAPNSDKHVHVNIIMDDENNDENLRMTAAIARQVALITHYPNFKESDETTRTVISIIYKNIDSSKIKEYLNKYTGNLLSYCQFIVNGIDSSPFFQSYKNYMPLDIAVEIRQERTGSSLYSQEAIESNIRLSDVMKTSPCYKFEDNICLNRSMLINMAYNTGVDIDNLPAYDNANIKRYSTALDYFFNHSPQEDIQNKWAKTKDIDKLSCLFCADCINERLNGLLDTSSISMIQYIKEKKDNVIKTIENNIETLALCEHSRWNVEKLILGFRPYNIQERFTIESLFGEKRKNYKLKLKDEHIHLDLCSYKNLRRIDPGNIKYDYFLMLAIPHILLSNYCK